MFEIQKLSAARKAEAIAEMRFKNALTAGPRHRKRCERAVIVATKARQAVEAEIARKAAAEKAA
jgi:hypothetical protein